MTLEALLQRHGYTVHLANTGSAGMKLVAKVAPDMILLDLGLPDASGLDLLRDLRSAHPESQVIILTAQDSLSNAIETIKLGAYHFISKPYAPEELLTLLTRATEQRRLVQETKHLRAKTEQLSKRLELAEEQLAPTLKGRRMQEIGELIKRVAPTDANILLLGESGVGKEVMANYMHRLSRRCEGPLIKLNCAAFPPNMIEAELFGYVKGAFTGAVTDFPGMIREAEGGTLFLDEIAEMPLELQTRFLRVLQERECRPLGATKSVSVNFRLVAATNRAIAQTVQQGGFRQDLFYRLNTFQIELPPLRDRREEIPSLVSTFIRIFATQMAKPEPQISVEALQRLKDYSWPGNIRELRNAVEYAVVLADDGITERHLPPEICLPAVLQSATSVSSSTTLNLDDRERESILAALKQSHGNKKKAATLLGIHRPTLYNKMKRYGIEL
ncbi:MAG: Two component, sigma54 specific, transcriptional regulator, Fis family [Chthoniobacter sp.]|nr:Two component, sigma54 specific, transcriptional regulator, Fis family [Chthoniobacter sp.]